MRRVAHRIADARILQVIELGCGLAVLSGEKETGREQPQRRAPAAPCQHLPALYILALENGLVARTQSDRALCGRLCAANILIAMKVRSCTRDEGQIPRSQPSGAGFKPRQVATVESRGGERCGRAGQDSVSYGSGRRAKANPLMTCRKRMGPCEEESADAAHKGTARPRSNGEGGVMAPERRGCAVQLSTGANRRREELHRAKPSDIPKPGCGKLHGGSSQPRSGRGRTFNRSRTSSPILRTTSTSSGKLSSGSYDGVDIPKDDGKSPATVRRICAIR